MAPGYPHPVARSVLLRFGTKLLKWFARAAKPFAANVSRRPKRFPARAAKLRFLCCPWIVTREPLRRGRLGNRKRFPRPRGD